MCCLFIPFQNVCYSEDIVQSEWCWVAGMCPIYMKMVLQNQYLHCPRVLCWPKQPVALGQLSAQLPTVLSSVNLKSIFFFFSYGCKGAFLTRIQSLNWWSDGLKLTNAWQNCNWRLFFHAFVLFWCKMWVSTPSKGNTTYTAPLVYQ